MSVFTEYMQEIWSAHKAGLQMITAGCDHFCQLVSCGLAVFCQLKMSSKDAFCLGMVNRILAAEGFYDMCIQIFEFRNVFSQHVTCFYYQGSGICVESGGDKGFIGGSFITS